MSIFDYNKGGIFHAELIFFFFLVGTAHIEV